MIDIGLERVTLDTNHSEAYLGILRFQKTNFRVTEKVAVSKIWSFEADWNTDWNWPEHLNANELKYRSERLEWKSVFFSKNENWKSLEKVVLVSGFVEIKKLFKWKQKFQIFFVPIRNRKYFVAVVATRLIFNWDRCQLMETEAKFTKNCAKAGSHFCQKPILEKNTKL